MTRDFRDKVVVITGSSAGIGRATAIEFARQGAKLALLARGSQRLQPACDEAERAGGTAIAIETDVADSEQVEAAAGRAESELGPIDVWINNAMASVLSPIAQITPAEVAR